MIISRKNKKKRNAQLNFFNPLCTATIKLFRQLCFFWYFPRIIEGPGFTGNEEIVWFLAKKICSCQELDQNQVALFSHLNQTQPLHVTFYKKTRPTYQFKIWVGSFHKQIYNKKPRSFESEGFSSMYSIQNQPSLIFSASDGPAESCWAQQGWGLSMIVSLHFYLVGSSILLLLYIEV